MHTKYWWKDASVIHQLVSSATSFEFIQSVRLLRHAPVQDEHQSWADAFDFSSSLHLNFPKSEIESLSVEENTYQIKNLIVGLTGIQGALPYVYTNKMRQAPRKQRAEVEAFLGLFNNKLIAQYIEASLTYNLPVRYEVEEENHYLNILHSLSGYIGTQHQQTELQDYFAEFSGLMQGQNNTVHALKTMLSCIFHQQVEVKEFIKEKFKLEDQQKTVLGGTVPSLLGVNTFCGETVTQIDGKIELVLGPLSYQDYIQFLPEQPQHKKLKDIIQTWCSPTLMVDIRLVLLPDAIEPLQLRHTTQRGLGQGAFLGGQAALENRETCYALFAEAR
ncbi:type VI secretion system baseplate subunit TssG [Acinetobacter apis]|uniref:Type VI secretion system protein ImpH n=1 Tax=Acinetobacter apis TaxID=1229165 RepID=A0A217EHK8_9GAMM|nr:type VI secretion system baseplate subunit TssG [Acinetobacter apis]SNQ29973.1 type VI secretion system protein ImpH [Acinetobacter apis]